MPYRVSSSTFIHPSSYDNLIEWSGKSPSFYLGANIV